MLLSTLGSLALYICGVMTGALACYWWYCGPDTQPSDGQSRENGEGSRKQLSSSMIGQPGVQLPVDTDQMGPNFVAYMLQTQQKVLAQLGGVLQAATDDRVHTSGTLANSTLDDLGLPALIDSALTKITDSTSPTAEEFPPAVRRRSRKEE